PTRSVGTRIVLRRGSVYSDGGSGANPHVSPRAASDARRSRPGRSASVLPPARAVLLHRADPSVRLLLPGRLVRLRPLSLAAGLRPRRRGAAAPAPRVAHDAELRAERRGL